MIILTHVFLATLLSHESLTVQQLWFPIPEVECSFILYTYFFY